MQIVFLSAESLAQDRADKLMEQGRYAEAAKIYERYLKRSKEDTKSFEMLGNAYRYQGKYKEAELNYERTDALSGLSDVGFVNYGQMLIRNGKSAQAKNQFERYLKAYPESFVVRLMSQSIREVETWSLAPKNYTVNQIRGINSQYADFSPAIYKNGIIYTTERNLDYVLDNSSPQTNLPYMAIYYAKFKDDNGLVTEKPKNFLTRLYGDYQVGTLSVDRAHNKVYFSEVRSSKKKSEVEHLKIYTADIVKDKRLTKPELLPFNADTFSVMHPSVTPDGNTIFFASNQGGEKWKMDIYVAHKVAGGWTTPTPLEGAVNTELNEVFPYGASKDHLFFSSNGHTGYGGLDIYESYLVDGKWTKPVNLKSPINSEFDDFGICFRNEEQGYFSSERDGGQGRDDIYQFVRLADPNDTARMEVSGFFDYSELPPDGFKLQLFDENDNLLEESVTDSLGNFAFTELPTNKKYRVEVANASAEILDQSSIYLLNEEGEKVMLLDRVSESQFAFTTLKREEFESLSMIETDNSTLGLYDIFGQLYAELPSQSVSGISLVIVDDDGNIIQETLTDSIGLYSFDDLATFKNYTVKYQGKDSIVYLTTVFYQNSNGIVQVLDTNNSLFELNRLKLARTIKPMNAVPAKGLLEYDGYPLANVRMLMLDSNDRQLRAALSDENGSFDFGEISADEEFRIILPDSINELEAKANLYFLNSKGEAVVFADNWKDGTFAFKSLRRDEYEGFAVFEEDSELTKFGFHGQVFRKLAGDYSDGLKIFAVDDNGRIVETVYADSNGFFDFTKLQSDQHYSFRVAESDQSNLNVDIYDLDGNLIAHLRLDELSQYMYERLQSDDRDLFRMLEEDKTMLSSGYVAGSLYKKLPGDYKEGIMVYAVDEQGNIIDSAMTDGAGNFAFKSLSRERDFTLQVMDEDDSGLNLGFYDYDGKLNGYAQLGADNTYNYSKLVLEAASELGEIEEIDDASYVYGRAYIKLPGDYPEGTRIVALDPDGKIVEVSTLNKVGKFTFKNLAKDGSYFFRIEEDDDLAKIELLDRFGNLLQTPEKAGEIWVFDRLAHDKYSLALKTVDDSNLDHDRFASETPKKDEALTSGENIIYFDYKSSILTEDDSLLLWGIVKAMRADEGRYLKLNSHTDQAESLGNRSFSALRSVAIVQYLDARGISTDRIYVQNWEDTKPIIDCSDGIPCNKEDRKQNQRTELSIVDISQWPTTPDYIITYDFNEWMLPAEGSEGVFAAIKVLKENPEALVKLDGYADTWGTYAVNQRISELRAENIRNIIIGNNISEDRVEIIWHGESVPFGGCLLYYPCPVDDRKQNRRVEIRLQK